MPSGKKRTHEEFLHLLYRRPYGEDIVILSDYKGEKRTIKCRCKKCGYTWDTTPKTLLSGSGCKACNNIVVVAGFNDLATVDPQLASEWDYEKNADLLPTTIGAGSRRKAHWICYKGHRWEAVVYDRHTKKTRCPYCAGKLPIIGETDLATLRPELMSEWNFDRNTEINPHELTEKSSQKVWWICEFGHEWQAPVYSRSNGIGCPFCAKELQTSFPEQALLFYINQCGYNADDQLQIGKYKVDIAIPALSTVIEYDGERWHRNKIEKDNEKDCFLRSRGYRVIRIREKGLCRTNNSINLFYEPKDGGNSQLDTVIKECLTILNPSTDIVVNTASDASNINKQFITKRKNNSFEKSNPELVKYWDYEQNSPILPDMINSGSRKEIAWKCPDCGFRFRRSVQAMVRYKTCPVCIGKSGLVQEGYNDLLSTSPELSNEWDYTKNDIGPAEIAFNDSTKKVWWRCHLGHSWSARVTDRFKGNGCPYCKNKRVLSGFNDLLSKSPQIAELWDYEKNDETPDKVLFSSKKDYYWLCRNGHSFVKSPYRLQAGEGCPYCASRRIMSNFNSLSAKNPELAKEWNYEKNLTLTPEMIMPNSMKKVWWKGLCGHEWEATVANRNSRGSGCPYCAGRKVLSGFNDLKTRRPDIAAEWNYEKNAPLLPTEVTSGSSKRVWWKCENGHEWEASIDKRCLGRGCPICRHKKV